MTAVTGWIWAIGRLLGISTAAGVRMWATLFMISLLSREGWGFHVPERFDWLESTPALLILLALTIVEIASDKVPSLERVFDRPATPLKVAVGALAGACALGHGWLGGGIGLAAGGAAAWLALHTRRAWRPRTGPGSTTLPLISLLEDLAAAMVALLSAVLPPVGYAVFGWTIWLFVRLRGRRAAKYRGLGGAAAGAAGAGDET